LRGAGSSRKTAAGFYYGGCVDDIRSVLAGLDNDITREGVFAIGFSLGGNILLNTLAQDWAANYLVGAATVSAPIRPVEAAEKLMEWRNATYHYFLLHRMKREVLSAHSRINRDLAALIRASRSIYEFDHRFTAPCNGYRSVEEYYERTAGAQFIAGLTVPTLLVHACNDPWIPVRPYLELKDRLPPGCQMLITSSGGHVGFHEHGFQETKHDRATDDFITGLQ
jgi:predicted alpha/beta-fold hydrolase